MWQSPNGTIRNILGGTIFRQPILCSNIPRIVSSWKKPIVVARHAHGDQYMASEIIIDKPGKIKMIFEPNDGSKKIERDVFQFDTSGVAMTMYNIDKSIISLANPWLDFLTNNNIIFDDISVFIYKFPKN